MAEPGLALLRLVDLVTARFAGDSTNVPIYFGLRAKARQRTTHSRIVWVPGDDKGSGGFNKMGQIVAPRDPGRMPRHLADVLELSTVYCCAADVASLELERAQYAQARVLFDAWFRAVYRAAHGIFDVLSTEWVVEAKERSFGGAIRVVLQLRASVPDIPLGSDFNGTELDGGLGFGIDVETLSRAEPPEVIHSMPLEQEPE